MARSRQIRRCGEDKPSWQNAEGRLVAAYRNDASYHCHLAVIRADPILAYTQIAPDRLVPDDLVLVCITTHRPNASWRPARLRARLRATLPEPAATAAIGCEQGPATKEDDTD